MDELITSEEAQRISQSGVAVRYRTVWLAILGVLIVLIATILVMIGLTFRGARTGLEGLLPSSNAANSSSLQFK